MGIASRPEIRMVQYLLLKLFFEKIYCTYGALKSKKSPKLIEVSIYKGKMTP
jgi:hypothetical protein